MKGEYASESPNYTPIVGSKDIHEKALKNSFTFPLRLIGLNITFAPHCPMV